MHLKKLIFLFLFSVFGSASLVAHAQNLKKVSPSKYETRAPAKSYSFSSSYTPNMGTADKDTLNIEIVIYRSDNGKNPLYGVLDKRGKRPKWILQPHFEDIREFGETTLAVKRKRGPDSKICILNINNGNCSETDFPSSSKLTYNNLPALPDWVHLNALYKSTERDNVIDIHLYSSDEQPLTIVRNVLASHEPSLRPLIKVFSLDNRLVVRTVNDENQILDAVISDHDDGTLSVEYQPAFSAFKINYILNPVKNGKVDWAANTPYRDFIPMRTTNADLGLVWPIYRTEDGAEEPPENLLGLLPLTFRYQQQRRKSGMFDEDAVSSWYCCSYPIAWAVAWDDENGTRYAIIPQIKVPSFDAVIASRSNAVYSEIEKLWEPGWDHGYNARDAQAEGQLIGKYAFHRTDGKVDIVTGDTYALKNGTTIIVENTLSSLAYPDWLLSAMQAKAKQQAAATAAYKARQEQKRADRAARQQALAVQRQRLARKRLEAREARQAELAAQAAAREQAEANMPQHRMERITGSWALARIGYCRDYTEQTDLRAEAHAKKACRDKGGDSGPTYVTDRGVDPFAANADQCYSARAVTECYFNK